MSDNWKDLSTSITPEPIENLPGPVLGDYADFVNVSQAVASAVARPSFSWTFTTSVVGSPMCKGKKCKSKEILDKGLCGPCLAEAEEIPEHLREGWIACYKELVEEEKKEQQCAPVAPRPAFRIPLKGGII